MGETWPIRVGVNAVIVSDGRLLVVGFDDETGPHYNLPGGGVEQGEPLQAAVVREVREETSVDVDVGDLLFAHEYHPERDASDYGAIHKLTLFFECEMPASATPTLPEEPDPNLSEVTWLSLEGIETQPLLPDLGHTWRTIVESEPSDRYLTG